MSEFEFLIVLVSIVFGVALTQIMSGAVRSFYEGTLNEIQILYTLTLTLILVIDWWVSFSFNLVEKWEFGTFLLLVLWAMVHYVMVAALYPPISKSLAFERRRQSFFWAFIVMLIADGVLTAVRGSLFEPWYYLPFILHYIVIVVIGLRFDAVWLHRIIAWWLPISFLIWALYVRTLLSEVA
ncbi:MAG: hypothetical protein P8I38_14675 [Arenicella sp.]|nr:hypothetical protein [Arenicella sp.]